MKLLLCPHCQDVVRLVEVRKRACECGASWGQYTDDINAVYGGAAIMLGISNPSLQAALSDQLRLGDKKPSRGTYVSGREFAAFIIPESAPSVRREPKEK